VQLTARGREDGAARGAGADQVEARLPAALFRLDVRADLGAGVAIAHLAADGGGGALVGVGPQRAVAVRNALGRFASNWAEASRRRAQVAWQLARAFRVSLVISPAREV